MLKILVAMVMFVSVSAFAAAPYCSVNSGGYCSYGGKVKNIYVNSGGIILLYFDTPMPESETAKVGYSVSNFGVAGFKISDNPEFAKLFYSTALAAQASGRPVSIQMRGVISGYLKFDRIWLAE